MQEVQEVIKSAGGAGIAKMRRCCWCCYAITKKAAFLRPLIIQTLHQATCWLPMLPVRQRYYHSIEDQNIRPTISISDKGCSSSGCS